MAITRTTADELRREREKVANEFLSFRKRFLCTQIRLAELLNISRRAVQMAESGVVLPLMSTRRRFRELQREFANKKEAA